MSSLLSFASGSFNNQETWSVNYNQNVNWGQWYSQTPIYTYDQVLSSPQVAPDIDQPDRLNQVACLLNEIDVGSTVAYPSSQKW